MKEKGVSVCLCIYLIVRMVDSGKFFDAYPSDPDNPIKIWSAETVRQGWTPGWSKGHNVLLEWITEPPNVNYLGQPLQVKQIFYIIPSCLCSYLI